MPFIVLDPTAAEVAPAGTETIGAPLTNVGKTLAAMRADLTLKLGRRPDLTNTEYDRWINDAYVDVATGLDIEVMKGSYGLVTVADQPLYVLPAGIASTRGAAIVDTLTYGAVGGIELGKGDLKQYRNLPNESGQPELYFREGNVLVLWPTPSREWTIAVDYVIRPQYLVNATDSPIVPLEYHEAIVLAARQKGFADLQEFDKSQAANNDFVGNVRRRKDEEANEQTGRVIGSSVPRRRGQVYRGTGGLENDVY